MVRCSTHWASRQLFARVPAQHLAVDAVHRCSVLFMPLALLVITFPLYIGS